MLDGTKDTEIGSLDGKRLEVVIKSMPTERSYSKTVHETCFFDMTGLLAAAAAVNELRGDAARQKE